ncbi:MAG: bifunctional diaminohydroxyphosphoribosylaminopyrimidine deaminase/5-amino-6-(5-phosphoribosylamino)uracil reductase RibD [Peptococcaceae bacterium]|nr:bifunctional diaminohydroxyphosphoribosylaminopyrimidine deaminase/5-amino-6-(5-phosphoribosylamino)uracil reductase RibD [Peptococcaceae bacterium]
MNDQDYMRRALALAERGRGWTAPNPMVGAVIVRDGRIIAEGWHVRYGELHAERAALAQAVEDVRGATMYVTLEPCCHQGKQPPCTEAIIASGIKRVVIGSADANPLVAGKGVAQLRANGIVVTENVLRAECDALNEVFLHYIREQMPYVVLKTAMTLDGKIATRTGASRWVTGEAAREHGHGLRQRYSAIMVGVGTILADDPLLTCRIEKGCNPLRIVCDTHLCTPLHAQLVRTAHDVPTLFATCEKTETRIKGYEEAGCHVWTLPEKNGHVDLVALMRRLGAKGIDSVLIEGGGTLAWTMLESGLVQKIYSYIAPKLFGGCAAKTPIEGEGVAWPEEGAQLALKEITRLGDDLLIESEVINHVHRSC